MGDRDRPGIPFRSCSLGLTGRSGHGYARLLAQPLIRNNRPNGRERRGAPIPQFEF